MRNKLNKTFLEELYLKEGLSLKQIANKLDKGYSTIHYWMRKHHIPRRPLKIVPVQKKTLFDLYIKKKINTTHIAKMYKCDEETIRKKLIKFGIPRRSNSESKTKYPKISFSGDSKEKAYMLGLQTGDLSVRRNHAQIIVRLTTTHKLMVELVKNVFGKYGHVTERERVHKGLKERMVTIALDKSFEFLLNKAEVIPDWILSKNTLFYSFLAGYIDADGCWKITWNGRKGTSVACTTETQDKQILKQITAKLVELGFAAHFYKKSAKGTVSSFGKTAKDVYTFCLVRKEEVVKLAEILKNYEKHQEKLFKIDLVRNCHDKDWVISRPKVEEVRNFIKQNVFK